MNYIDFFLVIIFLLSLWSGYKNGFIAGMLSLFVWLGSLLVALLLYQVGSGWLSKVFPSLGAWSFPLAFLLILILTRSFLSIIIDRFLYHVPKESHQSAINKTGGIIPGAVNGFVWATLISALLLAFPLSDFLNKETRDSRIANRLSSYVEWMDEKFSPVFDEAIS